MPSMTTRPMASAHVMPGSLAMPNATNALSPSPVASASGKFADDAHEDRHDARRRARWRPRPAAWPGRCRRRRGTAPVLSAWVPMISGLSTTM